MLNAKKVERVKSVVATGVSITQACKDAKIPTSVYYYYARQKDRRKPKEPTHVTMILPDKKNGSLSRVRSLLEMAAEELSRIENA